MLRKVLDFLVNVWARLHARQVVKTDAEIVKVNVGSGLAVAPGWINLDGSLNAVVAKWPSFILRGLYRLSDSRRWYSFKQYQNILRNNQFIHHRVDLGLPFQNESVDYIYTSHLLEHLYKPKSKHLLEEAFRVLKPNGMIRVCIPDLEHAFKLYQEGKKDEALHLFFPDPEKDAGEFNRHKYMYDYDMLHDMLDAIGFQDIRRCAYQEGQVPDLDQLDNRPAITLFVEARKGA